MFENQKVLALMIVYINTVDNRIIASPEASPSSRAARHSPCCSNLRSFPALINCEPMEPILCPSTQKLSAIAVRPENCCQHQAMSGSQRPVQ